MRAMRLAVLCCVVAAGGSAQAEFETVIGLNATERLAVATAAAGDEPEEDVAIYTISEIALGDTGCYEND